MINPTVDGIVATGLMVPTIAAMYLAAHISLETWIYRQHMFGHERFL